MRLPVNHETLERAAQLLGQGGLVAFPTETVYGLGANALDPVAVARIFAAKQRPTFDPLIVHVSNLAMLQPLVKPWSVLAQQLMDRFWPGPLTLALPKKPVVPDLVTAGLPTVAVRMPQHPVALELIQRAGCPVAAPSANPFGFLSPTRAQHVEQSLGAKVDLILDGGPTRYGLESTIVLLAPHPVLLRHGAIPQEALEEVVGPLQVQVGSLEKPLVPGQLPQHYAPRTPIRLGDPGLVPPDQRARAACLAWQVAPPGFAASEVLSPGGNLLEAAAHLFEALHRLDASGVEVIYAQPVPPEGLGRAIMDRLQRAAHTAAGPGAASS